MPVLEHHKAGLRDLLQTEKNTPILLQLSKSTTKHVFKTEDPSGAAFRISFNFIIRFI